MKKYIFILVFLFLTSVVEAQQIPDLDAIDAVASGDLFYCVDVSDTTDRAEGTGKKCTNAQLKTAIDTNTTYTAGDALTLTGTDIDFDGGATPGGELGNTWASPTIADDVTVDGWTLGNVNATTIIATTGTMDIVGNASTATALAANPAACTNQFARDLDADGTITCESIADADVPNGITIDLATTVTTNANLTGDVTSTGNATDITESVLEDGGTDEIAVTAGMVNAGTNADATTYFRGDNTWVTPSGSGDVTAVFDCASGDCNAVVVETGETLMVDPGGEIHATETVLHVNNDGGSTIFACTPVYISGFDVPSNLPEISIADADDATKMPAVGLAQDDIAAGANGIIITTGDEDAFDTSTGESWAVGDALYINDSGTSADDDCGNALTNIKPSNVGDLIQKIGIVMRVHGVSGEIELTGAGRSNDVPLLEDGKVWVGNENNVGTAVDFSGDVLVVAGGTVTLQANSVDSDEYTDASIDLAHMSSSSVDSDNIVNNTIANADMADNSIDSDDYVNASIDHAHLADDVISGAAAVGTFTSGDTVLCLEAGVGLRECDYDDFGGGWVGTATSNLDMVTYQITASSGTIDFDDESLRTSGSITINADDSALYLGASQDASLYFDGSDVVLLNTGNISLASDDSKVYFGDTKDVSIYLDSTEGDLVINTGSVSVLIVSDGNPLLGAGNSGIYHDGTDGWLCNIFFSDCIKLENLW